MPLELTPIPATARPRSRGRLYGCLFTAAVVLGGVGYWLSDGVHRVRQAAARSTVV